ncbi:hypothetical protein [Streptomyces sp. ME18-1-4]|uniref:hypothetical protein n=1 Tax=Streptomyces sp. ME18-1-4 TaxID=3028685 RepID=UPI0029B642EC|nr:hypothetical protein [Streptomyces sp. ME18-1-4]MDX3243668.1 hypothetical protein [Streptomyces sp. ME18-1-4]
MPQTPSVGRIVHYVSYGTPRGEYTSQCRAAVITEVGDWPEGISDADKPNIAVPVGLCVMNPTGLFFHPIAAGGCRQSELDHIGGTWHWPERTA